MKSITKLLIIEDNAGDARLLREMLRENATHETELTFVTSMGGAEKYLDRYGSYYIEEVGAEPKANRMETA